MLSEVVYNYYLSYKPLDKFVSMTHIVSRENQTADSLTVLLVQVIVSIGNPRHYIPVGLHCVQVTGCGNKSKVYWVSGTT